MRTRPEQSQSRRAGVALLMVLLVVASSTVLTLAMLASSSMRSQGVGNAELSLQAIYLSDGGIELALFYLQYPTASSVSQVRGPHYDLYWPGESNITFTEIPGSRVDISVANIAPKTFRITSVGFITGAGGDVIERSRTATIYREKGAVVYHALSVSDDVILNSNLTVNGSVRTSRDVLGVFGTVTDTIYCRNPGMASNRRATPTRPPLSVPSWGQLDIAKNPGQYIYRGQTYNARSILTAPGVSDDSGDAVIYGTVTLDDTDRTGNPANVWYVPEDLEVRGVLVIDGTLFVHEDLDVRGQLVARARNGLPAVIVGDRLTMESSGKVDVNGLLWLHDPIHGNGLTLFSTIRVVGAVMIDDCDGPVLKGYLGSATITYDSDALQLDYLYDRYDQPGEARIIGWND